MWRVSGSEMGVTIKASTLLLLKSHPSTPSPRLNIHPIPIMSTFFVPPSPRGRTYSHSQPAGYPYSSTPYSNYNALPATPYYDNPGLPRSGTYYVAPSVHGRGRSRSHSRPRRSHSHHRSHHGHHHGQHRRSHSTTPRYRSSANVRVSIPFYLLTALTDLDRKLQTGAYRYQTGAATAPRSNYYRSSPSLGERILSFFGLGSSSRHVDRYGRSIDSRGRPKYK